MAQKELRKLDKKDQDLLNEIDKVANEKVNKKVDSKKDKKAKKDNKPTAKKESWFKGVKSEFKKVRWPNKKEMVKYSIATISFIIFFALFFFAIEGIVYLIKTL